MVFWCSLFVCVCLCSGSSRILKYLEIIECRIVSLKAYAHQGLALFYEWSPGWSVTTQVTLDAKRQADGTLGSLPPRQPQLNKASKSTELEEKGDRNPKEPGGNANRRSSSSPETPRERGDFTCFHAQKGRFSPGSSPGSTQDDLLLTLGLLSHILRFGR